MRRFLFDIAVATGSGWDVDEMAAQMPLALAYEWMAYARMNKLVFQHEYLQQRSDWNAGMLAAVFTNVMSGLWAKKGAKKKVSDFMYEERPSAPQTPSQMYQMFKTYLQLSGVLKQKPS